MSVPAERSRSQDLLLVSEYERLRVLAQRLDEQVDLLDVALAGLERLLPEEYVHADDREFVRRDNGNSSTAALGSRRRPIRD